jgi:solute carrier family 25 (mitochondrial phosphate transporter), member 3
MLGGVLACGLTHAGITPLDVAKCNMQVNTVPCPGNSHSSHRSRSQVNPAKYTGSISSLKTIVAEEGTKGVWKGFGPTLVGYSLQGMFKYGLYEIFKDYYMNLAGQEASDKYKGAIWLAGSASAEFFADIALCPLEMTKVKIQTSPAGTFPVPFGAAWAEMSRTKVETRFPFGSIVPLWSRQVRSCLPHPLMILSESPSSDSIHDGQVLLFREDCSAVLHPRFH